MNNMESIKAYCINNSIRFEENDLLKNYTTFKTGGPCSLIIFPHSVDELKNLICFLKSKNQSYFVIGKGSNLLFKDSGYNGIIINTVEFDSFSVENERFIKCFSGSSLTKVCRFALENSLTGLEFAYGIPGSVGGAVYMNAGAYGGEISDVVYSVDFLDSDGNISTYFKPDLNLSYRHSIFEENNFTIVQAVFKLQKGDKQEIKAKMDDLIGRRKSKQPLEYPSAGSTFKRPEGYFAGALIEECGLKGYTVGDAMVSEKHAGFVINKGNASSDDILSVIDYCRQTVLSEKGVLLEPEVKIIG